MFTPLITTVTAANLRSKSAPALVIALLFSTLLLAGSAFAQATFYQYRIPVAGLKAAKQAPPPADDDKPDELTLTLAADALPVATRGETYSFNFATLLTMTGEPQPPTSSVSWQLQGALPTGITFNNTNGTLSGTPSAKGEKSVKVTASFESALGEQTYTIVVNGAPYEVVQLTGGDEFTCALLLNRTVKCWGSNAEGRLGDGTVSNRTIPVSVAGLANVAVLAGGHTHTCALLTDGTVQCWGSNSNGQLGDGTKQFSAIPVPANISGVKALAAGYNTTCALLTANSEVKCWGQNNEGQLGNGGSTDSTIPVSTGLTGVRSIGAGFAHACAVMGDAARTVKCWGRNIYGELGNGTKTSSKTPVTVKTSSTDNLHDTQALAMRSSHTCSLSTDNRVYCWGFNGNGRVGNGTNTNVTFATQVIQAPVAVAVAVGSSHTCAILDNGAAWCWGRNHHGQLGFDTGSDLQRYDPGAGPNLANVTAIALGQYHTCAALADGTAKCWGYNNSSQVGDGTTSDQLSPVPVQW